MNLDLTQMLQEATQLVYQVGAYIRQERIHFSADNIEHKGLHNLVSYVDKTAEKQLVEGLSILCAAADFQTEEETIASSDTGLRWIIDPLDGTTNFIHGVPVFSISIALANQKEILLGIVYEINLDEMFTATQHEGAYLNGKPIKVSRNTVLGDALLATGFPYTQYEKLDAYMEVFKLFMQQSHGLRRMGSAAVDLAYVACGRFEGFFEFNLHAWDVAAGALIVQEAGGRVTEFSGGDKFIENKTIVASNALIHPDMIQILKKFA